MKITYEQTFHAPLTNFGLELVRLIKDGDLQEIASRFGYARAFDRPLVAAIGSDIEACLSRGEHHAVIAAGSEPRISVKYFEQPNSLHLFGLVECFMPLEQDDGELLVELIVSKTDAGFHLILEDVSYIA